MLVACQADGCRKVYCNRPACASKLANAISALAPDSAFHESFVDWKANVDSRMLRFVCPHCLDEASCPGPQCSKRYQNRRNHGTTHQHRQHRRQCSVKRRRPVKREADDVYHSDSTDLASDESGRTVLPSVPLLRASTDVTIKSAFQCPVNVVPIGCNSCDVKAYDAASTHVHSLIQSITQSYNTGNTAHTPATAMPQSALTFMQSQYHLPLVPSGAVPLAVPLSISAPPQPQPLLHQSPHESPPRRAMAMALHNLPFPHYSLYAHQPTSNTFTAKPSPTYAAFASSTFLSPTLSPSFTSLTSPMLNALNVNMPPLSPMTVGISNMQPPLSPPAPPPTHFHTAQHINAHYAHALSLTPIQTLMTPLCSPLTASPSLLPPPLLQLTAATDTQQTQSNNKRIQKKRKRKQQNNA